MSDETAGKVLRSGAAVLVAVAIAKAFGAVRELLIARQYGVSGEVDAFFFAFTIVVVPATVLVVAFPQAFVPVLVSLSGDRAARAVRTGVLRVLLVAAGAAVVILATAPFLMGLVGESSLGVPMLHRLVFLLPLYGMSAVMTAVLVARGRLVAAAMVPVVTPAVVVVVIIAARPSSLLVIASAVVAAAAIEVLVLSGLALPHVRGPAVNESAAGESSGAWPILGLAALLLSAGALSDQYFASTVSQGGVALLAYANKIPLLLVALVSTALGTAALSSLSRASAAHRRRLTRDLIVRTAMVSVPLTAVLIAASPLLIDLLLRGSVVTAAESSEIADVQRWYLLQVPFFVLSTLLLRRLMADRRTGTVLTVSAATLAVNVVADFALVRVYGVSGVAMGASLAQVFLAIALGVRMRSLEANTRS